MYDDRSPAVDSNIVVSGSLYLTRNSASFNYVYKENKGMCQLCQLTAMSHAHMQGKEYSVSTKLWCCFPALLFCIDKC
jgi:hypothetical protein